MGDLLYPLAVLIFFTIGTVSILRRAGYSGWWVLLAFVPLVNFIVFFVFAFCRWPIEQELARYRVADDAGSAADFETVFSQAISSEKTGDWDQAAQLFELLKDKSSDKETKTYAEESLDLLKQKLAGHQSPRLQ